ncbi:hypothetical protein THASP1DRAFT_23248 [Thamnocephalis sphaerospora]|uniref:Late embryogenesis abundant protein LEA-2 subgroup domain-containing protein n=1 Tax=Thamnocephalis sphaerospora TaxID=78915 RepID=A0A4P9XRU4_9FUNG|nr:hypothetical protein THASP1DRAFT_23248 [Thamnocephalis sphaerospora]|eukprot:RKP08823.1 hypothetical protein THASP1DRAFT_23248 [Thamnocephalis sphaerospora]
MFVLFSNLMNRWTKATAAPPETDAQVATVESAGTLRHAATLPAGTPSAEVSAAEQTAATLRHGATFPLDHHEAEELEADAALANGPIGRDGRLHRRRKRSRFADACGFTKHGCPRLCAYGVCIGLLVVLVVVLAVVFWARAPEIGFGDVEMPQDGTIPFKQVGNGFILQFFLLLQITNPNFIGASFTSIKVKASMPVLPSLLLANGSVADVDVARLETTTVRFPFQLSYSQSDDPKSLVLADLADRCGIRGNHPPRPIHIIYSVLATWKVGAIKVQLPEISSMASFDCPVTSADNTTLLTGVPDDAINQARLIAPE